MIVGGVDPAVAATQIGETSAAPNKDCGSDRTYIQSASTGASYAAPHDGVITSWSARLGDPAGVKFKVARGSTNSWAIVATSDSQQANAGQLLTRSITVPVHAGASSACTSTRP